MGSSLERNIYVTVLLRTYIRMKLLISFFLERKTFIFHIETSLKKVFFKERNLYLL